MEKQKERSDPSDNTGGNGSPEANAVVIGLAPANASANLMSTGAIAQGISYMNFVNAQHQQFTLGLATTTQCVAALLGIKAKSLKELEEFVEGISES